MTSLATGVRRRNPRIGLWLAAISLLSLAVGWFVGSRMVSSAEAAARRQPPGISVLTAKVEQR